MQIYRHSALHLPLIIFGFNAFAPTAQADTPAQAQQAIQKVADRIAASYESQDVARFTAGHSSSFVVRNVQGRTATLRQEQDTFKRGMKGRKTPLAVHCRVSQVTVKGSQAAAVLHWSFADHHARSASVLKYTYERDYDEQTLWQKSPHGWVEASADMTRDTVQFKR